MRDGAIALPLVDAHAQNFDDIELPLLRTEATAGRVLGRLVVGSAAWLVLGSLACALLALAGLWLPLVAAVTLLVLGAVSWWVSHLVPMPTLPRWSAGLLVVVSVAAGVWTGVTHSEQVLPRRDSGSYLQSAIGLTEHHRRPIEVAPDTVGGAGVLRIPGITLGSPAFFEVGTLADPAIQPQFMVGPSAWYSVAWWLGGATGAMWAPAVLGALGTLAVGLLAAVTVGGRWAPLAATGVAISVPVLHVDRSTYSEPLATLTLAAGLLALTQAVRFASTSRLLEAERGRLASSAAYVAGALVGGTVMIRADALRETILLIPVAALGALQRRAFARPMLVAAALSTVVSFAVSWVTSSVYLRSIGGSLVPLVGLGVLLAAGSAAVVRAGRRGRRLPELACAWLPRLAAGLVVVTGLFLASRPLWQTVRQSAADHGSRLVANLQAQQGLPVDGGRTYAEQTLVWMSWWVGPLTLVIALAAAAALAQRAASRWVDGRPLRAWTAPLLVGALSSVLTWYRPGITPDHPWADRRLLIALPFVVLLVTAAAAVLTRWSTRRMPLPVMVASSAVTSLVLLVPTALATWPHAGEHVERGELAAVRRVCAALSPHDVVLTVDARAVNEWPQVVRGMCGVPALSTTFALRNDPAALTVAVREVSRAVASHGGHLVMLAADSPAVLKTVGAQGIMTAVDTTVLEDPRLLERRPDHLVPLPIRVWLGGA